MDMKMEGELGKNGDYYVESLVVSIMQSVKPIWFPVRCEKVSDKCDKVYECMDSQL